MILDRPLVRAPEFPHDGWINTPEPPTLRSLRGRAILIHFWDYTCINCLRTFPYLRAWHARYTALGLQLIGVHTPEFSFARERSQVEAAAGRLGIRWPVVLDNDQALWQAFANRAWPGLYLIDAQGYVRYRQVGEGAYRQLERGIQEVLSETHPELDLPEPVPPVRPEDAPGALCLPTTPEIHADAAGNLELPTRVPLMLSMPESRLERHFYLEGLWHWTGEGVTLAGERGRLALPYRAADVYAVLAPSPDSVSMALGLDRPLTVALEQDGAPLPQDHFGQDVFLDAGLARLRVDVPRLYHLVRNPDVRLRELTLAIQGPGLTVYAFSFGSCLAPDQDRPAFRTE